MKTKYIILLIALFCLLIFVEHNSPKPVDWTPSFSKDSKKPYGSYALYKLIQLTFPAGKVITNSEGFYLYNKQNRANNKKNILILTSHFKLDKLELETFLSIINEGNNAFISALFFDKKFIDTLKIKHIYDWNTNIPIANTSEKAKIYFTNSRLDSSKSYSVEKNFTHYFFSSFDTLNTLVLGRDEYSRVNFICMNYGKGKIFLHSMPYIFTNYNILFGNYEYTFKALSHLENTDIVWDEYYKPQKPVVATPMRFILSQPALKAAYFLLLAALIIYLIFEAKRRQRIIPIIKPPKNTSLEFAETVGRLYLNNANLQDIVLKKFNYFCELIRTKYYFSSIEFSEKFYFELSEKSGIEYKSIEKIFLLAAHYKAHSAVNEDSLIRFNAMIEEFWRKAK